MVDELKYPLIEYKGKKWRYQANKMYLQNEELPEEIIDFDDIGEEELNQIIKIIRIKQDNLLPKNVDYIIEGDCDG